jgi:spore maturation protein CgeB
MNPISFADFLKVPIHKDPYVSKVDENGNKVLARYYQATGAVHVHPDHWDEFLWKMDEAANATPEGDDK